MLTMILTARRLLFAVLVVATLGFSAACGNDEAGEPAATAATPGTAAPPTGVGSDVPANLFRNGSFESGPAPWISLTTEAWGKPFTITDERAHSGRQSALLELRAESADTGPRVFGVVQELGAPAEFPEVISGYYRVEDWVRGAQKQYLQFVVIAFGATNLPGGHPNHQIRYILGGVSEPPLSISNAKYIFLSKEDPPVGEWVYFEVPVGKDFAEQWGDVPTGYDRLRLLFEVRYDDKAAGTEGQAKTFYDDLYMGPTGGEPGQP